MEVLRLRKRLRDPGLFINKGNILQTIRKATLRTRLLFLFVSLLFLSICAVGISSHFKAKDITMETIEGRLAREAELMQYTAENLKFVYIGDEDYFMQQLESSVRSQQKKMMELPRSFSILRIKKSSLSK